MSTTLQPVKIALGADFLTAFSSLPQKQQRKVRNFLDDFTSRPDAATHNYEKIHGARDPNLRSVRVDQDYRGIVLKPAQGNVYVLLWVDKHDQAYDWATRRTCSIHPDTGTMQVVLTSEAAAETLSNEGQPSIDVPSGEVSSVALSPFFGRFADEELLSLGVPAELLVHVRSVRDENDVDRLESILPREAFEGVFMLAAGYNVAEARAELAIDKPKTGVDTSDFSAAVERDGSRRQFLVITDAAEMEKILAAPLEQWRVFLHPSQRKLVEAHMSGPVRVLGSAGTGKTVVAMHRAVWLARHVCEPGKKVLLTTFTRNLAADISANLKKICSREEWERIEVVNLDAWTKRFLDKQGFQIKLTYEATLPEDLWTRALTLAAVTKFSPEFIRGEWDNVIQAHGVETWEEYMAVSRAGRTHKLSRPERKALWPVFEEYRALLNERGLSEPADAFRSARRLLETLGGALPYRAVVVDEAQDFGNEAFRLIRQMVPSAANDVFIVGDAHQRIYGHQVVLSRCGLDIRGRGRKLRINYRTTEELKNWATALLKGLPFDDLDAGSDTSDEVRSLVHGEPPLIRNCDSEHSVADAIVAHLKPLLASHARPETICVVAQTHRELEKYRAHLKIVCSDTHQIEPGKPDDGEVSGVRLATIHRVKGLEFDHVILAGIHLIAAEEVEFLMQKRSLLYVAATRARKSLLVCWLPSERRADYDHLVAKI